MEPWEAGGDNATTPTIGVPVAPPTTPTYAYVYINYAIAGINGAIALFAIFVLIMQTRNLIRAPKLLFIHIILFLVCTYNNIYRHMLELAISLGSPTRKQLLTSFST
jgi:hypothetical protein